MGRAIPSRSASEGRGYNSSQLSIQDAIDILQNQVGNFGDWGNTGGDSTMPGAGMTNFQAFLTICQGVARIDLRR